jgi:hypothetical protein
MKLDLRQRKQIMQEFECLPEDKKAAILEALERLRPLYVLWGLDDPENASLPDVTAKRQVLLAYRGLNLIWFDQLPEIAEAEFAVHVAGDYPETLTWEMVSNAFDDPPNAPMQRPVWLRHPSTHTITTSLAGFPNWRGI